MPLRAMRQRTTYVTSVTEIVTLAQHFLLSAAARTLKLKSIYKMGEDAAWETFKAVRFADNGGEPYCPACGCVEPYFITTRRKWKCKGCAKQFSVTSGTIFASRKLDFTDILAAIAIFVNAAKGISSLQLARDLDVQYKTAFVMAHKLREVMGIGDDAVTLSGDVEIDGMHIGGHVRPANHKENRKDRRRSENKDSDRRVVVAMRERGGRTLTFVETREGAGVARAVDRVAPGSTMHADEASHWDALHGYFRTTRINHSELYADGESCTNQAESFFSRIRRAVWGQHHHVSPQHLHQYATENAWREDNRRCDNKALWGKVIGGALAAPVSRNWKGYWQRRRAA